MKTTKRTNEELVELHILLAREGIKDTVQALKALRVDYPLIRSGLYGLKDQLDLMIQDLVEEEVNVKRSR